VVWTRGRWEPDLVPQICDWFADRGFELGWVSDPAQGRPERGWPERGWGAGAHRFTAAPVPLERGARMFTFTGRHPRTGPDRDRSLRAFDPERTGRVPRRQPPPGPNGVGGPLGTFLRTLCATDSLRGPACAPGGRLDGLGGPVRPAGSLRLFRDPRGDLGP